MSTTVTVKVKQSTTKQGTGFEGTVELQGVRPTKLTRKDGATLFPTANALKSSARAFANRLNAEVRYDEPVQKAAKQSVKSQTSTTSKATSKTNASKKTQK